MSFELLLLGGFVVTLAVIGIAGLTFDLLHRGGQPHSMRNGAVQRHAAVMFRYYREVGDSHG